jgi:mRNA-degrading endonuclease RelE of RelBE toxin-antitoxin system
MTDVEITPQAGDQLAQLETETRERVLKELAEA